MREKIIAGNWKMNTSFDEASELTGEIVRRSESIDNVSIVLFPPATHFAGISQLLSSSRIEFGAQNVHWEDAGAYTGELSTSMLIAAGCRWVIAGHSERRQYFGETDRTVNMRAAKALEAGLRPIVCIGETLEEREAGNTFEVLKRQLSTGLKSLSLKGRGGLVIAYEPIWAIGTGKTATPEQAEEAHRFIRNCILETHGKSSASETVIQYGGSVNDKNASELLSRENIDGALVGGASLNADKFMSIIQASSQQS